MTDAIELTITDLARSGAGVARDAGGRVIFVPLTAPGDRVRARICSEEKKYALAEAVEVLEPSPGRVEPRCSVFGRCGGCMWQHIPYQKQWTTKLGGVMHALGRVGLKDAPKPDEFPAHDPWNYRNRIQLRGNGDTLGFYARKSHDIVAVDTCPVARQEINAALAGIRTTGSKLVRPYKAEVEVLPDGTVRTVWNAPHGAGGFRQLHDEQNTHLQAWVGRAVPDGSGVVFDLFGGSGNLSRPLAGRAGQVHCVDISIPPDAGAGAPGNMTFHRTAVLRWLIKTRRNPERFIALESAAQNIVIVDPPRIGLAEEMKELLPALAALKVQRVVAVGCDPDSWARDLCKLTRAGWRLTGCAVFDFFPQTPHVECAGVLEKPDSSSY
ncbi:MAG: hypothetical protein A2583_01410 [Bdellovibrionales bacterium RIFOXYD1_FULL_53_11]|nr:MAG: hypothetical protein A2583_01410 [Bdellovibrionales bacterium RIFOXYD1_FULL_53_11]